MNYKITNKKVVLCLNKTKILYNKSQNNHKIEKNHKHNKM